MSANATATARIIDKARAVPDSDRGHRIRLYSLYVLAIVTNLAIFIYGFDYYKLSSIDRPFSPKHHLLRPSGPIGLYLGFMGVSLFVGIFLYPIRKHWAWLGQIGKTRHWLDIHVLMGLTAPFIIAFHSTLKFRGIAGMAFWIMFAVSASGVVGRYLYAQIPRKVTTAELSMKELQDDVQHGQNCKGVAERLVHDVPEMKHLLRSGEEHHPLQQRGFIRRGLDSFLQFSIS